MNSFKNALLASSVLTTVGFGASATTFVEDMTSPIIIDFSNTPAGANPIDFSMFQSVQGTLSGSADPADYFTFTGLTAGDDFSITFNRLTGSQGLHFHRRRVFGDAAGGAEQDGHRRARRHDVDGRRDGFPSNGTTFAEGYSVALSEIPAGIPEPSTAAIFAVGLAGLAVARRKRCR